MSGAGWQGRLGPGALIVLVHVLLAFALLRHAGSPQRGVDAAPAEYIMVAFIAAPKTPQPERRPVEITPPAVAAPARPRHAPAPAAARSAEAAPSQIVAIPATAAPDVKEEGATTAAQPARIDMLSLRAAARQVDSERMATPEERSRESQQLRASDDSALGQAVRRAKRPDCQTKYAGGEKADLLLLIPLAIETITDKGCKW